MHPMFRAAGIHFSSVIVALCSAQRRPCNFAKRSCLTSLLLDFSIIVLPVLHSDMFCMLLKTCKQTNTQKNKQKNKQTNKQTNKTNKQTNKRRKKQTNRQTASAAVLVLECCAVCVGYAILVLECCAVSLLLLKVPAIVTT